MTPTPCECGHERVAHMELNECFGKGCLCKSYSPEKNDAPAYHTGATEFRMEPSLTFDDAPEEWKIALRVLTDRYCHSETIANADESFIALIASEKARSAEESYQKGYEEGRQSAGVKFGTLVDNSGMYEEGFKAGVQKAMEVAEGMLKNPDYLKIENKRQYDAALSDLLTTLEKL